jgi:hypothetical protein
LKTKTICLLGAGRSGKDTAGEYLELVTGLKFAGTTSLYLARHMGEKLGLSAEEAYRRRHESNEMRTAWYNGGNELRLAGPSTLARRALEVGPITGGLRDDAEVKACQAEGLFDLYVWVANGRVAWDPTIKFGPEVCDVIIENHGSLADFYRKLDRLAAFAGLLKGAPCK